MAIIIRDNQVFLRYDKRAFNTSEITSSKEYSLNLFGEGFEILHAYESWQDSGGIVKNKDGVYYVSYQLKNRMKQLYIKEDELNKLQILSDHFCKTDSHVFWNGNRVAKCDAASFKLIENTMFGTTNNAVFAFDANNGASFIELDISNLYFIPYCHYFADANNIYQPSSWDESIEPVPFTEQIQESHTLEVVNKNVADNRIAHSFANAAEIIKNLNTCKDLFSYFFPDAKATWNN